MKGVIQILHLEDNLADRELVRQLLVEGGIECVVMYVYTREEFTSSVQNGKWDVILADYALPDFDGAAALEIARRHCPHTPFIFLSGVMGEDVAVESLKSGATDYVLKQRMKRLCPAVRRALKEAEVQAELESRTAEVLASARRSETFFRGLLEAAPNAVVVTNAQDEIVLVNHETEKLFGYRRKELIGQWIKLLLPERCKDGHQQTRPTLLAVPHVTGNGLDFYGRRQDGTEFPVEIRLGPLATKEGILVSSTIVDITERRRFEQTLQEKNVELENAALQLQTTNEKLNKQIARGELTNRELEQSRKEQNKLRDEFFSNVSHELRSPLTAIYQFVTILLDGLAGELNPQQHEYLTITLRNINQLQAMINDLLEITRAQAGKLRIELQCTSVCDALVYTIDTFQGAATFKGITLSLDKQCRVPSVCADPRRIRQILTNLVDNAIKFTPANGAVKLQARVLEEDPAFVVLGVSDSGCGIGPDKTERIFEHLYQITHPGQAGRKGLGLGLYIAKELVTKQGGRIWVSSEPRKGSHFFFTVPIFSLANLIAPALRNEKYTEGPITLVVTEIGSQTGWLSDEVRVEKSQRVRDILQQCLNSDLDVLLPKMGSGGAAELFFIVAITDEIGGKAITERIRKRLNGRGHVQQAGLTLSTYYRSLEGTKQNANESMEDFLKRVATNIQDLMSEEISSRIVKNGQQENSHCG